MLPDLSPHLHTDECNQLIAFLQNCHKEHSLGKMWGKCTFWDEAVWQCTKKERIWRRNNNPKYGKHRVELKTLPEAYYTPVLIKLKEEGKLRFETNNGCKL